MVRKKGWDVEEKKEKMKNYTDIRSERGGRGAGKGWLTWRRNSLVHHTAGFCIPPHTEET